jgi:nucleotide-binding universal stress UspA family protein
VTESGRIVVGVDGSAHARRALRWAIDHARQRGATVDAVHAWQYVYAGVSGFQVAVPVTEGIEEAAQATLDHAVDAEATAGDVEIRRVLAQGPPAQVLLEVATGADHLVVGSRGRGGFAGLLLGSVSQQVSHHAPCPVVIIPAETEQDGTG